MQKTLNAWKAMTVYLLNVTPHTKQNAYLRKKEVVDKKLTKFIIVRSVNMVIVSRALQKELVK
jgi:hypothetical protein